MPTVSDRSLRRARRKSKVEKKSDLDDLVEKAAQLDPSNTKSKRDKKRFAESTGAKEPTRTQTIVAEEIPKAKPSNGKKRKVDEPLKSYPEKDEGTHTRKKAKAATDVVDGKEDVGASGKELSRDRTRKKAVGVSGKLREQDEEVFQADNATPKSTGKRKGKEGQEEPAAIENEVSRSSKGAGRKERKLKSIPKTPSPPSEPPPDEEWGGVQDLPSPDEKSVHLHGFSTDDDSSEDDGMDDESVGLDVAKLPTIAKDDVTVKWKLEKASRQSTDDRGVLYLGRIPHGMYEDQLRSYFTQFGEVTRLRLSRNKKTGRSKSYAFIEFSSSSVARIVADTMDNYLLTGHILRCKLIPKNEIHPELWVGANRKYRVIPQDRISREAHNKPRTEDEQLKAERRLIKRQKQKQRKLAEAGIKYDFGPIAYKQAKIADV